MLSESARMNSAAEARFRIQTTSVTPRATRVIALDTPSEKVVKRLAERRWEHATFLTASGFADGPLSEEQVSLDNWLKDLAGQPTDLTDEVDKADLVIMVATPGGRAHAAPIIGEACSLKRVMTTGLVVGATSAPEDTVSKTLSQLRPWCLMVVIADPDDYVGDILIALRA